MSDDIMTSALQRDAESATPVSVSDRSAIFTWIANGWAAFREGSGLDRMLPRIFLVVVFALGSACATIVPIDQVPDETAHIARAAALLHGALFGRVVERTDGYDGSHYKTSGVKIDSGLQKALRAQVPPLNNLFDPPKPKLTAQEYKKSWTLHWTGRRVFEPCPNSLQYLPVFYLPGAAALGIAGGLGASPTLAILVGRFGMLFAYAAMGLAALLLTRRGRPALFALLCLPLPVGLAGSFNQDAQLIAATALACALITRNTSLAKLIAGILLAFVIASKPPYIMFAGLMLLPLAAPGLGRRIMQAAAIGAPGLIWYLVSKATDLVSFHTYMPYVSWPWWPHVQLMHAKSSVLNLQVLLRHPWRFITMPAAYLGHYAIAFEGQGTADFGQNSVYMSPMFYLLWFTAIIMALAAVMMERPGPLRLRWFDRIGLVTMIIVGILVLMDAIYISWAMLGQTEPIGVTGRYFLLFQPVLMLALPAWAGWGDKALETTKAGGMRILLTAPAVLMALFDVIYLPAFLAHKFYLGV